MYFFYLSVHSFFILNLISQLHVLFLYSEVATRLHQISKINESAQMNTRLNYKTQVMYRGHCLWTLRNHLWLKFLHEVGLSHLVRGKCDLSCSHVGRLSAWERAEVVLQIVDASLSTLFIFSISHKNFNLFVHSFIFFSLQRLWPLFKDPSFPCAQPWAITVSKDLNNYRGVKGSFTFWFYATLLTAACECASPKPPKLL